MMLNKRESNKIYREIIGRKLDPAEFDLEDSGAKVLITHNSGSIFELSLKEETRSKIDLERFEIAGTEIVTSYDIKLAVMEGIRETNNAHNISFVISHYIPHWLREIQATVGVPDYWAELKRDRRSLAIIQRGDFENTVFSGDEQQQIASVLYNMKKQVKEQFALSSEQVDRVEKSLDELVEASKRMGRKDWVIYFLGAITALVITATVTAGVGEHISVMVIQGLIHLFTGGNEPPQISPRIIT